MITHVDERNRLERLLGETMSVDLTEALSERDAVPAVDPVLYVYLIAGTMDIVRPATSVAVTGDSVVLSYLGAPVATYARHEVSFCSNTEVPPFSY